MIVGDVLCSLCFLSTCNLRLEMIWLLNRSCSDLSSTVLLLRVCHCFFEGELRTTGMLAVIMSDRRMLTFGSDGFLAFLVVTGAGETGPVMRGAGVLMVGLPGYMRH